MHATIEDAQHFVTFVKEDDAGCWLWQGAKKPAGYGNTTFRGRNIGAHRLSYMLFVGEIPDKMQVCHKCDKPECVNPLHLWCGTRSENMQDAKRKGRLATGPAKGDKHRGVKNTNAKLNPALVQKIRAQHRAGRTCKSLAPDFGVSATTIQNVVNRSTWKHVKDGR